MGLPSGRLAAVIVCADVLLFGVVLLVLGQVLHIGFQSWVAALAGFGMAVIFVFGLMWVTPPRRR